jgi:hypothetical protein
MDAARVFLSERRDHRTYRCHSVTGHRGVKFPSSGGGELALCDQ